jgi:threonine/homoserine/homoserine lactone efflux protein
MDTTFLLKGIVIGFAIAAPVGPIGVLCIRRTLARGRASGLLSGLGAATADAVYGAIAAFGLTFITAFLLNQQFWLKLGGGLFLCYLGLKTAAARPAAEPAAAARRGLLGAYASTFALTLTNPATILSFVAIFAGAGLAGSGHAYGAASTLVLGVFMGSAAWWLLLSGGVGLFRTRLQASHLRWVNRIAGFMIGGFGLLVLLSLVR